jgi:hypothetical protein
MQDGGSLVTAESHLSLGSGLRARCRGGHRGAGTRHADGTGTRWRVAAQHGMVLPDAQRGMRGAQLSTRRQHGAKA